MKNFISKRTLELIQSGLSAKEAYDMAVNDEIFLLKLGATAKTNNIFDAIVPWLAIAALEAERLQMKHNSMGPGS
jgi:hypothetical protein